MTKVNRESNYRAFFEGIEVPVRLADGTSKIPINFDNGATTPPFKAVNEAIMESIGMYGAVHRGGQKAFYSTEAYEQTKLKVLKFFNLTPNDGYCVIYVKNTTEGLNLLAQELCNLRQGTKVISTRMEHHANDLPWRRHSLIFYWDVDEKGVLKLQELEKKLQVMRGTVRYVTVTGASNVTGYVNPIHQIARIVHKYGARLIVDAAQLVAHRRIDMKGTDPEEEIDGLVFSAHKMYAPFGTGVVIVKQELLQKCAPHLMGGGAVEAVFDQDVYYKQSPDKEEAGTPNYLGVIALAAAIDQMSLIGMEKVSEHEDLLKNYLIAGLRSINKVKLYGEDKYQDKLGVVTFNINDWHHQEVSDLLAARAGIAVRNGCFCAHPYVARLLRISEEERYELMSHPDTPPIGMVRISLGLYNTIEEVLECLEWIKWISQTRR